MTASEFVQRSNSRGLRSLFRVVQREASFRALGEEQKIETLGELAVMQGIPLVPRMVVCQSGPRLAGRTKNPIVGSNFVKPRASYPLVLALDDIAVAYVRLKQAGKTIERFCLFLPNGLFVDAFPNRDDAEEVARQLQAKSASVLRLANKDKNVRDLRLISDTIRASVVKKRPR